MAIMEWTHVMFQERRIVQQDAEIYSLKRHMATQTAEIERLRAENTILRAALDTFNLEAEKATERHAGEGAPKS